MLKRFAARVLALAGVVVLLAACTDDQGADGLPGVMLDLSGAIGVAHFEGCPNGLCTVDVNEFVKITSDFAVVSSLEPPDYDMVVAALLVSDASVFIAPAAPVRVGDDPLPCGIMRVARDGATTCVDYTVQVRGDLNQEGWPDTRTLHTIGLQADASGAIYYAGASTMLGVLYDGLIRRLDSGESTDILDLGKGGIERLRSFVVLEDGTVFAGTFVGGGADTTMRLRRIAPDGTIADVPLADEPTFYRAFPDGNLYLGTAVLGEAGVERILAETQTIDRLQWIGHRVMGDGTPGYRHAAADVGVDLTSPGSVTRVHVTTTVAVAEARRHAHDGFALFEFFPTPRELATGIASVTLLTGDGEEILVGDLDDAGVHRLVHLHLGTDTATDMLDGQEIVVLGAMIADRHVVFSGHRSSDGAAVLGIYDLTNGLLHVSNLGFTLRAFHAF